MFTFFLPWYPTVKEIGFMLDLPGPSLSPYQLEVTFHGLDGDVQMPDVGAANDAR